MRVPFERVTDECRRMLRRAAHLASRCGCQSVCADHIGMALVIDTACVAHAALMGIVSLTALRAKIRADLRSHQRRVTSQLPPFSRGANLLLRMAALESRERNQHHVGTEHLLFVILRRPRAWLSRHIQAQGVKASDIYQQLGMLLSCDAPLPLTPELRRPKPLTYRDIPVDIRDDPLVAMYLDMERAEWNTYRRNPYYVEALKHRPRSMTELRRLILEGFLRSIRAVRELESE